MKALIIALFIWIFVVPAATALLLIFGLLAVVMPGCYSPCFFLVLILTAFCSLSVRSGTSPFRFECPVCSSRTHTIEEKTHDEHQEVEVGS